MKMDQYIRDIGNFVQREQENLPKALERLQKMIKSCPYYSFSPQRLVHTFYGGVSSHNRTSLNATCGDYEDMCSNSYNNLGDKRIMKKCINYVEKDGKHMQALTLKIETLMRGQA